METNRENSNLDKKVILLAGAITVGAATMAAGQEAPADTAAKQASEKPAGTEVVFEAGKTDTTNGDSTQGLQEMGIEVTVKDFYSAELMKTTARRDSMFEAKFKDFEKEKDSLQTVWKKREELGNKIESFFSEKTRSGTYVNSYSKFKKKTQKVMELQELLQLMGYDKVDINGVYGLGGNKNKNVWTETGIAISKIQDQYGFSVDAVLGGNTGRDCVPKAVKELNEKEKAEFKIKEDAYNREKASNYANNAQTYFDWAKSNPSQGKTLNDKLAVRKHLLQEAYNNINLASELFVGEEKVKSENLKKEIETYLNDPEAAKKFNEQYKITVTLPETEEAPAETTATETTETPAPVAEQKEKTQYMLFVFNPEKEAETGKPSVAVGLNGGPGKQDFEFSPPFAPDFKVDERLKVGDIALNAAAAYTLDNGIWVRADGKLKYSEEFQRNMTEGFNMFAKQGWEGGLDVIGGMTLKDRYLVGLGLGINKSGTITTDNNFNEPVGTSLDESGFSAIAYLAAHPFKTGAQAVDKTGGVLIVKYTGGTQWNPEVGSKAFGDDMSKLAVQLNATGMEFAYAMVRPNFNLGVEWEKNKRTGTSNDDVYLMIGAKWDVAKCLEQLPYMGFMENAEGLNINYGYDMANNKHAIGVEYDLTNLINGAQKPISQPDKPMDLYQTPAEVVEDVKPAPAVNDNTEVNPMTPEVTPVDLNKEEMKKKIQGLFD